jgi:outer membrane protein assembly factor BamB
MITGVAMKQLVLVGLLAAVAGPWGGASAAPGALKAPALGSSEWKASQERPCGWRGDWSGRFPGATPPTVWSRRVHGVTTTLRYQAARPSGEPSKDSRQLEYFSIKDWLVAGPFAVKDPEKDIDQDFLGGEAAAQPAEGAKGTPWKFLRADVETQSRHDHNEGTCGQSNVDFVYAFGKLTDGPTVKVDGDFTNKVAYAHTYIFSPAEAKLQLQMPFDGTAGKFWLNGKPTSLDAKNRGKVHDIVLGAGWNRLLVKISVANGMGKHYSGRWLSAWMVAAYLTPMGPVSYETKNVTWMTKLTGRSMSQPLVVGDRIFVGANISDLMCLSKNDGRILWLRSTTPFDALSAQEKSSNAAVKDRIEPLLSQLLKQNEEVVAALNAAVSPQGLASDQAAAVDRKLKDKKDTEIKIHKAFEDIDRKKYPPYMNNEVSSSNATPCSDGARVYWTCGGGMKGPGAFAIVCFDLDGKRLWTSHEVLGSEEHGNHQSPLLVEGKLVFGACKTMLALDPKTGTLLWKNTNMETLGSGTSPVAARIGGASVIITAKKIIRAADGVEICPSNLNIWGDPTPVVEGGVIYNTSRFRGWDELTSMTAVRLPTAAHEKSTAQAVWDPPGKDLATPARGTNYTIASPLFLDGILYGVDMTGGMTAVDVQAQRGLYRRWLDGYNRYNRYLYGVAASPTLAGKYIYIVDDAGYTHLIQPGPQFKEMGKNVLENIYFSSVSGNPCHQEAFYTAPYFDGKAMYLRGEEYLYRIEDKQGGKS